MTATILTPPVTRWECPHCLFEDETREASIHSRMHMCKGMKMMTMPMVQAGVSAKVELVERGDYVGDEIVQTDGEGRPWMSAITTRDDGQDTAVFATTATAGTR